MDRARTVAGQRRQVARELRPAEVDQLVGDSTKALRNLGWKPTVTFEALVRTMVDSDLESLQGLHGGSL